MRLRLTGYVHLAERQARPVSEGPHAVPRVAHHRAPLHAALGRAPGEDGVGAVLLVSLAPRHRHVRQSHPRRGNEEAGTAGEDAPVKALELQLAAGAGQGAVPYLDGAPYRQLVPAGARHVLPDEVDDGHLRGTSSRAAVASARGHRAVIRRGRDCNLLSGSPRPSFRAVSRNSRAEPGAGVIRDVSYLYR